MAPELSLMDWQLRRVRFKFQLSDWTLASVALPLQVTSMPLGAVAQPMTVPSLPAAPLERGSQGFSNWGDATGAGAAGLSAAWRFHLLRAALVPSGS